MFNLFRKKPAPAPQPAPTPPVEPEPPPPSGPLKGRVMVVDDDAVVRKALGLKIGAAGYDLLYASDGAAAVTMARNEKPDVIILDVNFPAEPGIAWDGFKLLRWLHRSPEGARTPIIIITGEESPQYRGKAMEAGAVGFFQKPVEMGALISAIDQLIADSNSTPE